MRYYLLNDTRYRNDHGCLKAITNLIDAMQQRGAEMTGSLPAGQGVEWLSADQRLHSADLVIVNGEGVLHHRHGIATRNRLMKATQHALEQGLRVVLINALWQHDDLQYWRPLLEQLDGIWCRDRRSQKVLRDAGIAASYAPDMTFLSATTGQRHTGSGERYGFTDATRPELSARLLRLHRKVPGGLYLPMMLSQPQYQPDTRRAGDFRHRIYPGLYRFLRLPVAPRYRALSYASPDSDHYLTQLQRCRAVMSARYHTICFCLQQGVPWLGVETGSWESQALLEEIGLPVQQFLIDRLPGRYQASEKALENAVRLEQQYRPQIQEFNHQAGTRVRRMLDQLCQPAAFHSG